MIFARPELLWFLTVVPVMVIVAILSVRPKKRTVGSLYLWKMVGAELLNAKSASPRRFPVFAALLMAVFVLVVVLIAEPSFEARGQFHKLHVVRDTSVAGLMRDSRGQSLGELADNVGEGLEILVGAIDLRNPPGSGMRRDNLERGDVFITFAKADELPLGARVVRRKPDLASLPLLSLETHGRWAFVRSTVDGDWAFQTLEGEELLRFQTSNNEALLELPLVDGPVQLVRVGDVQARPLVGLLPLKAVKTDLSGLDDVVARAIKDTFGEGIAQAMGDMAEFRVSRQLVSNALVLPPRPGLQSDSTWTFASATGFPEADILVDLLQAARVSCRGLEKKTGDQVLLEARMPVGERLALLTWNPENHSLTCGIDCSIEGIGRLQGFADFLAQCMVRITGRNPLEVPGFSALATTAGEPQILAFPNEAFTGPVPGIGQDYLVNVLSPYSSNLASEDSAPDPTWFQPKVGLQRALSGLWSLIPALLIAALGVWQLARCRRTVNRLPIEESRLS